MNKNVTTPEGAAAADTLTGFHTERSPTSYISGSGPVTPTASTDGGPRRSGGSGCSVGVGEGFGEPVEEQVEASVEFGGAVVGGEGGCEGA